MKIIKVSEDLEVTIHELPDGSIEENNETFCKLIGNGCDCVEHVMPRRLYTLLGHKNKPTQKDGECVSMLVDECFLSKDLNANLLGSYLYETDIHGSEIWGNVLFVGEKWENSGVSFCGIEEKTFERLETQINYMTFAMKEFMRIKAKEND